MKSRKFQEMVSQTIEAAKEGHVMAGSFGMYYTPVACERIDDALTIESSPISDLLPFLKKNSPLTDTFSRSFFTDLEFPLNEETLLALKQRLIAKVTPDERLLLNFYEQQLANQEKYKLAHAGELKHKVDDTINHILLALEEAEEKLHAGIEKLDREISSLKKKNKDNAPSLFSSETLKIKQQKIMAMVQLVDRVQKAREDTLELQQDISRRKSKHYPSLKTLREIMSEPYKNAAADIERILKKNPSIKQHTGVGKIINSVLKFLTFGFKGYRTNTSEVIDDSMNLVDKQVRRLK